MEDKELLNAVAKKLYDLGVKFSDLSISDKKAKTPTTNEVVVSPCRAVKLMVRIGRKVFHFGQRGSVTYLEGSNEAKKRAYQARASKVLLKNGTQAINNYPSAAWVSFYVLWT